MEQNEKIIEYKNKSDLHKNIIEVFEEIKLPNLDINDNSDDVIKCSNFLINRIKNTYINSDIDKKRAIEFLTKILVYKTLSIEEAINNMVNDKYELMIDLLIEKIPEDMWFSNPTEIEKYMVPLKL